MLLTIFIPCIILISYFKNNYAYKTKLRHKTNEIMDTWFPLNFVQNTPFCVTMQILSMINYKKCQQITKSYV